jgi:hypothetical protein
MPDRPVPSKRQQQLQNRRPPTAQPPSPAVSEPSPPTRPSRAPRASSQQRSSSSISQALHDASPPLPTQTYDTLRGYPDALKLKALIAMVEKPEKWDAAAAELARLVPGKSKLEVLSFFIPAPGPLRDIHGKNIKGGRNAIISYLINQHIRDELIAAGEDEQKKVEIMSRIYRDIGFDPESFKNFWGSSKPTPRGRMKRTKKKQKKKRTKKKMKRTKKRN